MGVVEMGVEAQVIPLQLLEPQIQAVGAVAVVAVVSHIMAL